MLQHCQNDRVSLDKNFCGAILRKQLVDRLIEVQAEVRRGVHIAGKQRAREPRRIADIGLQNNVPEHRTLPLRFCFFRKEKLVKCAVEFG